ncbi:hypothetical protein PFISCL1PPCAC_12906, partial [Pristionchus fissidentatus]
QLLPQIGVAAGSFCTLGIGIDRLISVMLMGTSRKMSFTVYMTIHFVGMAIFASYSVYLIVAYYQHQMVICSIPSPYHGRSVQLWTHSLIVVNLLSVVVYFATWRAIKKINAPQQTRRVFRCICIVMIFDVGGWTITMSVLTVIYMVDLTEGTRFSIHYIAGIFVNFGVAIKAALYYWISTEYRAAMRTVL